MEALPVEADPDHYGYNRIPAFWFTLNLPFNYLREIHRFHDATRACTDSFARRAPLDRAALPGSAAQQATSTVASVDPLDPTSRDAMDRRCEWALNNPDIVVLLHAIRVELLVTHVMQHIVSPLDSELFQFWLRFEFGHSGNPHAHGKCYVAGNPRFDEVLSDEEQRDILRAAGREDVDALRTWVEAEKTVADFFDDYISEMHPCKDEHGRHRYDFLVESLSLPHCAKPSCFNLRQELETIFRDEAMDVEPDLTKLKQILVALIEDGQRHTIHPLGPKLGEHPCARKVKDNSGRYVVTFRYGFERDLYVPSSDSPGKVEVDSMRSDLMNLCLKRNDKILNNFKEEMLVANLGNIDWRALLNLWSVLEYLTKYTAKAGVGSKHLGKLFEDVVKKVVEWEVEDGMHDLWRRTIMKFYNRIIGDRDYSLFEVMHFGLRLPGTLSSFGAVNSTSVSNWTRVKHGSVLRLLKPGQRATYLSKLELFTNRCVLPCTQSVDENALLNLSFYAFWRLFDVQNGKIVKRRTETMLELNGTGRPSAANRTHPQHEEYAQRILYAYMPCTGSSGVQYIDGVVQRHYEGSWRHAFEDFVSDSSNCWCPPLDPTYLRTLQHGGPYEEPCLPGPAR